MTFSADWLDLRGDADHRARSGELVVRALDAASRSANGATVRILDLGAGAGATLLALAPRLAQPQAWTLVDTDASLLAEASRRAHALGRPDLAVATREADLTRLPLWEQPPDLVTASALFDLASEEFIERLVDALAADGVPILAMLTYDGHLAVGPAHSFDDAMIGAFNAHQRGEKSFGRAAGPEGAGLLADRLTRAGAALSLADTPWTLARPADGALMDAMMAGWSDAAREILPDAHGAIADWQADRATAATLFVGHRDLLAVF